MLKFHKVSEERWLEDLEKFHGSYRDLKLPKRATAGSAGYDFFMPYSISVGPNQSVKIPTGIRVEMDPGWVLLLFPRSSLGFKYRIQLDNTVGVIDSDYFYADNEGHIWAKVTNDTNESKFLELECGKAFMQGIFLQYGLVEDDEVSEVRTGGFGSTDAETEEVSEE
jgi:dUTP pyrophosphatase